MGAIVSQILTVVRLNTFLVGNGVGQFEIANAFAFCYSRLGKCQCFHPNKKFVPVAKPLKTPHTRIKAITP